MAESWIIWLLGAGQRRVESTVIGGEEAVSCVYVLSSEHA